MVKTYVPQELIDAYNKGSGIDGKEYQFITQGGKKTPDWLQIPAGNLPPPDLGPEPLPDFSEGTPMGAGELMPPLGSLAPIAPPPLPPMMPPQSSAPLPPVAPLPMQAPPPIPMALR